jgi:hypothetical protein
MTATGATAAVISITALITAGVLMQAQSADGEVSTNFATTAPGTRRWRSSLVGSAAGRANGTVMPRAIPMGYGEQRYDAFVSDQRAFARESTAPTPERSGDRWWQLSPGRHG